MNEYDPSGKIQRVPGGTLVSPGMCFSCGSGAREVYALLGHTQYEGAVYLCKYCLITAMTVFEDLALHTGEQTLRGEIQRLERRLNEVYSQNDKLRKLNESYKSVFDNSGIRSPGSSPVPVSAGPAISRAEQTSVVRTPGFAGISNNFDVGPSEPDVLATAKPDTDDAGTVQRTTFESIGPAPEPARTTSEPAAEQGRNDRSNARRKFGSEKNAIGDI